MKSADIEASASLRCLRRRIARIASGSVLAVLITLPLASHAYAQTFVGCNPNTPNCLPASPSYAPTGGGLGAVAIGGLINGLLSGPSPAEIQQQQQQAVLKAQQEAALKAQQEAAEEAAKAEAERRHQQLMSELKGVGDSSDLGLGNLKGVADSDSPLQLKGINDQASNGDLQLKTGDDAVADPSTLQQGGPCPLDANGMPECGAPVGDSMPNASANALQQYKKYDPSAVPAPPSPQVSAGDTAQPGWKQTLTQSQWNSLTPEQQEHLRAQWQANGKLSQQTQQQDQQVEQQTQQTAKEGLDALKGAAKGSVEDSEYGGPAVGASVGALKNVIKDEAEQRLGGANTPEGMEPKVGQMGTDLPEGQGGED